MPNLTPNDLPPETQQILEQNSIEIKHKPRNTQTVDFTEIADLLQDLPHLTAQEAYKIIGLSSSSYTDNKNDGKCRLVTLYAIKGLIAETHSNHKFNPTELATIFTALLFYQKQTNDLDEVVKLQKTIAKLLIES